MQVILPRVNQLLFALIGLSDQSLPSQLRRSLIQDRTNPSHQTCFLNVAECY